jgi:hypothetical protein
MMEEIQASKESDEVSRLLCVCAGRISADSFGYLFRNADVLLPLLFPFEKRSKTPLQFERFSFFWHFLDFMTTAAWQRFLHHHTADVQGILVKAPHLDHFLILVKSNPPWIFVRSTAFCILSMQAL